MYLDKNTAAERLVICDNMDGLMNYVTRARQLLMKVLDDFFEGAEQKAIASCYAEEISVLLHSANDALWWAETEYSLTVGDELAPGCEYAYKSAKRALLVRDVERLRKKIGCSETEQYLELSDEELLPILQELTKKKGVTIKAGD